MRLAPFRPCPLPTLGVELELQLVDARSMALRGAVDDLLGGIPATIRDSVKPEFHACCIEVNSGVCRDVESARRDLGEKLEAVGRAADRVGLRLGWGGTHPFAHWRDQPIVPTPRYRELADRYRETLLRQLTFGLHVHVGVEGGDAAIRACNRIGAHLPALLALSANSPFWCGRATGLHAHRIEVLASTPIGHAPPRLRDWADYDRLVGVLVDTGTIQSAKDLWWDVRPSPEFGTVEVRVCDMPADLPSALALAALIQCLVHDLSRPGVDGPGPDPLIGRQNRWRASRSGLDAMLIDPAIGRPRPAREWIEGLVAGLRGTAESLGCPDALGDALALARGPGGSGRQLAVFERAGDLVAVARHQAGGPGRELGETPPARPEAPWPPESWGVAAVG